MAKPKGKRGGGRKKQVSKDDQVEKRQAIGGNSELALPAPDDYAHHMKTIKGLKEKAATAQSLVRHAKTSANKCCPGLAASIEETLQIERDGDPTKLAKRLEMLGMGLKHIESPIQLTIHDSLAGDQIEAVYKRGFADGESGRSATNKYPEGSDLHAEYGRGWRHGMGKNLGQTPDEVDAAMSAETEQREAA